jgi:hypothetical protein
MFEVIPEPEFSRWFENLPETQAEEVSTALDLLANAGSVLEPTTLSRSFLWYDSAGGPGDPLFYRLQLREASSGLREFLFWHDAAVRLLESAAFRDRLARLSPAVAGDALVTVATLHQRLRAARLSLSLHRAWAEHEHRMLELKLELEPTFEQVLRLVGLEAQKLGQSDSGLRELTITTTTPQLRVLLGIDTPSRRILAILGEPLNRAYYGDSVRLAEARWTEYCEQRPTAISP